MAPTLRHIGMSHVIQHSLALVGPPEPILVNKVVNLSGTSRSVRVRLGLRLLSLLSVDPVENRRENL